MALTGYARVKALTGQQTGEEPEEQGKLKGYARVKALSRQTEQTSAPQTPAQTPAVQPAAAQDTEKQSAVASIKNAVQSRTQALRLDPAQAEQDLLGYSARLRELEQQPMGVSDGAVEYLEGAKTRYEAIGRALEDMLPQAQADPAQYAERYNALLRQYDEAGRNYTNSAQRYNRQVGAVQQNIDAYNETLRRYRETQAALDNYTRLHKDEPAKLEAQAKVLSLEADWLDKRAGEIEKDVIGYENLHPETGRSASTLYRDMSPEQVGEYMQEHVWGPLQEAGAMRDPAKAEAMRTRAAQLTEQAQAAQARVDSMEYREQMRSYIPLMQSADWAEKSKADPSKLERKAPQVVATQDESGVWHQTVISTGFDDLEYAIINGAEGALDMDAAAAADSAGVLSMAYLTKMTDEERGVYNYLYSTKGKKAAQEFLEQIKPRLEKAQRAEDQAWWRAQAQKKPWVMSPFSVLVSPLSVISLFGQASDLATRGRIDKDAAYNRFTYIPSTIRDEVAQKVKKEWGPEAGDLGSFLYQTGMSMADFLFQSAVTGGFAGGAEEAAGSALARTVEKFTRPTLLVMGTNAAASTVQKLMDEGMDSTRAFILGVVAGFAEILTENVSLEALLNPDELADGVIQYIMKNMLAEASEEAASDVMNWSADALYDLISGQSESEWKRSVRELETGGMSRADAVNHMLTQRITELGLDAMGGALSGGLMAVGGAAINRTGGRDSAVNAEDLLQAAKKQQETRERQEPVNLLETAQQAETETETETQLPKPLQAALDKLAAGEEISLNSARRVLEDGAAMQTLRDAGVLTEAVRNDSAGRKAVADAIRQYAKTAESQAVGNLLETAEEPRDTGAETKEEAKQAETETKEEAPQPEPETREEAPQKPASEERTETAGEPAKDDRIAQRTLANNRRKLAGETSLQESGFTTAGESTTRVQTEDSWDSEEQAVGTALREVGYEPTFAAGLILDAEENAVPYLIEGNRIAIQADNRTQSIQTIAEQAVGKQLNVDEGARITALNDAQTRLEAQRKAAKTKVNRRAEGVRESAKAAGISEADTAKAVRLANLLKRDIRFYSDPEQSGNWENGYTQGGVIYVNAAVNKHPMEWVIGHELTHNTEHAKAYQGLRKIAKQAYGAQWDSAVQKRMDAAARIAESRGDQSYTLSWEQAEREITADYFATELLTNEDAIRRICQYEPNTARRILEYLKNLLAKWKGKEPTLEWAIDRYSEALRQSSAELRESRLELPGAKAQSAADTGVAARAAERYLERNGDRQYSVETAEDEEYLAAVNAGDLDTAQRMVDEAAKAAGYDSPMLYHGTNRFGFTKFDPAKSDDGISLFATSDPKIAQTYSDRNEIRRVNTPQKFDTPEQILAALKETPMLWDAQYFPADATDRKADFTDMILDRLIMQLNERAYFDVADDNSAAIWKAASLFKRSIGTENVKQTARELYDAVINANLYWRTDIVSDTSTELTNAINMLRGNWDAYWYLGNYHNTENAIETLNKNGANRGNYALYGRTDGMLEIDGHGENWNGIPISGKISKAFSGERTASTREIARYGKDNGYTGVLIRNITDNGGYGIGTGAGDIYIYFDGISLKSADPVTYDDNGNVIPLTERFNPQEQDIRYSAESDGDDAERETPDTPALQKLGVKIAGSKGRYGLSEQLLARDKAAKQLMRATKKAEQKLKATQAEREFASGIASGIYSERDIPATLNRDTVKALAEYYWAEKSFEKDMLTEVRGQIYDELEEEAESLLEDADFRPMSMLMLNERTPERSFRRMFGASDGGRIFEWLIRPVQVNESEKTRWFNRQMDQVRTFEDLTGKQRALTREESALTMLVMEGKVAAAAVADLEAKGGDAKAIRNAANNILKGDDPGDAAREFGLTGEDRALAEQYARWMGTQERLKIADSTIVENAAEAYAKIFDEFYDGINDFLVAHGYEPIGYIKGYAPHMQPEQYQTMLEKAFKAMGINETVTGLPASIAGETAFFKPNKRWDPYFLHRTGTEAEYDIEKAYQSYVDYLSDILYHMDDIMRVRTTAKYLRKQYAPEDIREEIDWIKYIRSAPPEDRLSLLRDNGMIGKTTQLSQSEIAERLDEWAEKAFANLKDTTQYSNLVMWLDNYANILAGKQSFADRGWEYSLGRKSLNMANRISNAFQRSLVAGSITSSLNQMAQIPMIKAELGDRYYYRAIADILSGAVKKAGFQQESDFLVSKAGRNILYEDNYDKFINALFKPANVMDDLVSTIAVRGAYLKGVSKGMSHTEAMRYADSFGRNVMGSREKGTRPLAYESKGFFSKMIHMFQVEVANQWDHIASDLPQEVRKIAETKGKGKAARTVAALIVRALLSAFVLNRLAEEVYGGTPAPFDILGLMAGFVASGKGLATNDYLRSVIDDGLEKIGRDRYFGTETAREGLDVGAAAEELGYNVMNDVPLLRNIAGVLGLGDQTVPLPGAGGEASDFAAAIGNLVKEGVDEGEIGELIRATLKLGAQFVPAGRQLTKTGEGIEAVVRGGSYSKKGKLQYPVEGAADTARAILFGKNATHGAQAHWASGESTLSDNQTMTYETLTGFGISGAEARKYITDVTGYTADKDESGNSIAGSKKAKVLDRINTLDLTPEQKDEVYFAAGYGESTVDEAPWNSGGYGGEKDRAPANTNLLRRAPTETLQLPTVEPRKRKPVPTLQLK